MEQRRRCTKGDRADELGCRQKAAFAEQRPELIHRDEERDEVDAAERAFEDEARQPVVGSIEPVHRAATLRGPWTRPPHGP